MNNDEEIELLEELSSLEHEQWKQWSQTIIGQLKLANSLEEFIQLKEDQWKRYWVEYSKLDEKIKESNRYWARQVLDILNHKHTQEDRSKDRPI